MKRLFSLGLALSLAGVQAQAGQVNMGSRDKIAGYAALALGVIAMGTGYVVGRMPSAPGATSEQASGQATAGAGLVATGIGVAGVGAAIVIGSVATDALSSPARAKKMAAAHGAMVQTAKAVLSNQSIGNDPTFNVILTHYNCEGCKSDAEKSQKLARFVLNTSQIGAQLKAQGAYTTESEVVANDQLKQLVNSTDDSKNSNLGRFFIGEAYAATKL
jgi:hypothetical protein